MHISNDLKNTIKILYDKGIVHAFSGQFLTKFIALFGSVFVVRILTKNEYGVLGYYENIYGYACVFIGFGMSNAILRFIVLAENDKYSTFKYCIKWALIGDIIISIVLIIFNLLYNHPKDFINYKGLLYILALSLPFQDLYTCCLHNEQAQFETKRYAIITFLVSTIFILSKVVAAKFFGMKGVIILQFLLYFIAGITLFFSNRKRYYSSHICISISNEKKNEVRKYALASMITDGLWTLIMLNDTFLMGRLGVSSTELAEYKVAYVFPGNVNIVSSAIGIVVVPYFIKNEDNIEWIKNKVPLIFASTGALVALTCLVLGIIATPLIRIIYGNAYLPSIPVMRLLLISAFINVGVRFSFANYMASVGEVKYNMLAAIIGIVFQISLDLMFIPRCGVLGTAYSSIIVYSVMSIVVVVAFLNYINRKVRSSIS